MTDLPAAALAFDQIARGFDARFSPWRSVAAQRQAVRRALIDAFASGAHLLEIGGGTGEDALWLAQRGRQVMMTDASPAMVMVARQKFQGHAGLSAQVCPAEDLTGFEADTPGAYDGAWSNFAALNCVADLGPVAQGLARQVRPGGAVLLVVFGWLCPGEMVIEALRGRPRNMFRRLRRGPVPARLGGRDFTVTYHRERDLRAAMAPWFASTGRRGIGVFVPPSAAEPWISGQPRLLSGLDALDRVCARTLALLGDHVLYSFVRNQEPAPCPTPR